MKTHRFKLWITSCFVILCIFMMPVSSLKASAEYEVVFKAGLHGTINQEKSLSYRVKAGDVFPDEPMISTEAGYVFKGWNKALPEVGSRVEGKQVFVAQYDVLVSGVNYIVKYVNEDNVEIATPKASMAELDSLITERAKTVPGYTYKEKQKDIKIQKTDNILTFQYTLTNPDEVIRYEREEVNQVVGNTNNTGNQAGTNNNNTAEDMNNANNNTGNDNVNNGEEIKDNEVPLGDGDTEIDNNEIPLGKGEVKDDYDQTIWYLAGGAIAVIAAATGFVFYRRIKNKAV